MEHLSRAWSTEKDPENGQRLGCDHVGGAGRASDGWGLTGQGGARHFCSKSSGK